jgi:hypothetical protein
MDPKTFSASKLQTKFSHQYPEPTTATCTFFSTSDLLFEVVDEFLQLADVRASSLHVIKSRSIGFLIGDILYFKIARLTEVALLNWGRVPTMLTIFMEYSLFLVIKQKSRFF